jgi:hypothetical protein
MWSSSDPKATARSQLSYLAISLRHNSLEDLHHRKELLSTESVVLYLSHTTVRLTPCHDGRAAMSDAEQRETAESLFGRGQRREEIRDAIKLEEERRAAIVRNLYRLKTLRLERNAKQSAKSSLVKKL